MAHGVKVSDDDLLALGADPQQVARDPVATARSLLFADSLHSSLASSSPANSNAPAATQWVALTLGAAGAWLLTREAQVFQPSPQGIQVADTVGAGDSFFAALLAFVYRQGALTPAGLQAGVPVTLLQQALAHAVAAASINVARVGCNPATWDETLAFKPKLQQSPEPAPG
jgi:fructokinase